MEKKDYLFIFTITPVQSFIAQARKTRDLYAGSQILSELTKQAIRIAKEKHDAKIIMPYIKEDEDLNQIFTITNRFVARFENIDEEDLENIGKNIEFNTILHWKRFLADETLNRVMQDTKNNKKGIDYRELYKKFNDHITKYFNIYWLFYPIKNGDYPKSYQDIEKYLRAIKNVRCFEQFEVEENHRKCSICGERDAIVYKEIRKEKNKTIPAFAYKNSLTLPNSFLIDENEGLCGICFVKRFYVNYSKLGNKSFPSTSKIALLSLYNNGEIKSKIETYEDDYSVNGFFNEQLLFEENLNKVYLGKHSLNSLIPKLNKMKEDLQNIIKTAKLLNEPYTKYYALIKFDGDNMGKWLSGEFLKEENKNKLEEFHKTLSYNLRKYANWAKKYLDGDEDNIQRGKTIYAGGDDFLGFVNLNYLFEVLWKLKKEFNKKVNNPLEKYKKEDKNLSFSAGIVIAHYKDPLSLVLDWANQLENDAKNLTYKNAFGIAVLKRSGEIRKAIYTWDKLLSICRIYKSIVGEEFNSSFITKLEESFRKIPIDSDKFYQNSGDLMIESDLRRLLKRSKNKIDKDILNRRINKLAKNSLNLLDNSANNLFEILNILKFMERELRNGI